MELSNVLERLAGVCFERVGTFEGSLQKKSRGREVAFVFRWLWPFGLRLELLRGNNGAHVKERMPGFFPIPCQMPMPRFEPNI